MARRADRGAPATVGMLGYSWSGFNALQVAALRPPALKAIMSGYASDDRYADDVHYRGGLVAPMEMVHWSTCMHGWQARPPDPAIVGERWREIWLARLEQAPWIEHWLAHQRRDAYWQSRAPCATTTRAIECPVLCVAGWTDGYSDAALRLMEGLAVPRRALIGPWGHNDPGARRAGAGGGHPRRARALVGSLAEGHRLGHRRRSDGRRVRAGPGRAGREPRRATRSLRRRAVVAVAADRRRDGSRSATARSACRPPAARARSAASRRSGSTAAPGAPTGAPPICRSTSAPRTPAR